MTLTLLDLYNEAATQEWSMYDNDVATNSEMEQPLVLGLNKALTEILYSYEFPFRERIYVILTVPQVDGYELPTGIIKKDEFGDYCVKINGKSLKKVNTKQEMSSQNGIPNRFLLQGNRIFFSPKPIEKSIVTIEYITLSIGENSNGEEIFSLKNIDDRISVPEHLEELLKQAVIARTMLNSIASEGDENYSAYKKQSEVAYRLLVKYSKGVWQDKSVKI